MRPKPWILAGLLLASLAGARGMAAVSVADAPLEVVKPTDPAQIPGLVRQLQAADFRKRDQATLLLMRLPADQRPAVEKALARASDQETETRLEQVAVHLFMKGETAFRGTVGLMGVQMGSATVRLDDRSDEEQPAITITRVEPGFPAAEALQGGDRIIGMDGHLFAQNLEWEQVQQQFRTTVQNTPPGQTRRLVILRGSKVLQVDVKVAGLRQEDANNLQQVLVWRQEAAADYRAGLKKGIPAKPLLLDVAGAAPSVEANDQEGVTESP